VTVKAKDALKTLRNFVETTTDMDNDKAFSALDNLEDVVAERSNIKQTLLTDFFKKKLFVQSFQYFNYSNYVY